jgi:carnosine N-methyltransferase
MIADPVFAEMMAGGGTPPEETHSHSHGHGHNHTHHEHDGDSHGHTHGDSGLEPAESPGSVAHSRQPNPSASGPSRHSAQDKVRSTLRSFVRDWSEEGAPEREACYAPCLEALERHFPAQTGIDVGGSDEEERRARGDVKVLVPGCGLGRLSMEIAAKGESVSPFDLELTADPSDRFRFAG